VALGLALGGCCGFGHLMRLCRPLRHHQRAQLTVVRQHAYRLPFKLSFSIFHAVTDPKT
jgi:hypothetical protein